ncbi:MAG: dihydrodipicolinate synthase family protein [Deltaproteobacteria bacterium]|nr:dihydrodipicolinate synthase family protein [Deltaproteobacteria bacterium]
MQNKKPDWFKGIYPALVTPFTADDQIDELAYRELIRYLLPHVNGVVPNGTTGEFSSLTLEEKKRVISLCLDEVAGRVPVVAGTSCPSTRETLQLTRWAKEAGANAALVCAPYFIKPAFNEVFDHFGELNSIGLPLVLYNIPQTAGTHFRWWTTEGMALAFENVIGLKDSSGDMPFFMAALEKVGDTIAIFCGHDEIAGAAFLAGADGAILASANIIPDIWQEIFKAAKKGDLAFVQKRHKEIQILVRLVVNKGGPQACKEALRMMGLKMSDARLPLIQGGEFEREDYEDMRTQLINLGKIPYQKRTIGDRTVDYRATAETPLTFEDLTMCVGEGFAGPPFTEVAHIDLLLGWRKGPVGKAMDRALKEPRPGHELAVINQRPRTMLVPTVSIRGAKAKELVYEDAAAGINLAISHAITEGSLPEALLDEICLIANVFVHPAASIRQRVKINNYKAMRGAIRKAIEFRPTLAELVREKEAARHPFRYAP